MRLNIIIPLLTGISIIFGDLISFTADYFKGRHVTFICLLTCGGDKWYPHNFTKYASSQHIAVSSYQINEVTYNIKNLDKCLKQTAPSIGVLINPECPSFQKIMVHASENVMFDSKHIWLIIGNREVFNIITAASETDFVFNETLMNNTKSHTIEVLNNLNLAIDADITLSIENGDSSYELYEVYNFGKTRNGAFVIENIGDWNPVTGLNISKEFKYLRRWNFQQMAFEVAVVMTPIPPVFKPKMILTMVPDQRVAKITQTGTMVLYELTGIHNFSGFHVMRAQRLSSTVEINVANARIAQTFNHRELCELDSLHSMEHVLLYSCVQKHSPYREFFSWSLARLLEKGVIIHCIHERTWSHELKCEGSSPRALALEGAAPAFILLAGGFIFGTAIMLLERYWRTD